MIDAAALLIFTTSRIIQRGPPPVRGDGTVADSANFMRILKLAWSLTISLYLPFYDLAIVRL